ncbi:hypothetical protein EVAR_53397_1 [Eumeta japonica]|uniref:Uncharacterized protein n=1 Tax=Eumeta variegata TaxID=151549 RepID=A0A4C1Y9B3_EUMVA|nr:hypothetical protein EVAR_53397_1 [Eumeta japonica]
MPYDPTVLNGTKTKQKCGFVGTHLTGGREPLIRYTFEHIVEYGRRTSVSFYGLDASRSEAGQLIEQKKWKASGLQLKDEYVT